MYMSCSTFDRELKYINSVHSSVISDGQLKAEHISADDDET